MRYEEAAKVADREGYRSVAALFRACARAENAHADQHVHAIAYTGSEAKAYLDKIALGTTAENLRVAVGLEQYEARDVYPRMIAQARAERMTHAVRSMTYALAAEREHARLLGRALETLEQRPAPQAWFVCPHCGNTVASVEFRECPVCFGQGRGFVRID
jgi:rubrerythrin